MVVAVVGETSSLSSLESGLEPRRQAALFPLWPLPTGSPAEAQQGGMPCPGEYLRPTPSQLNRGPKQRNRAKMKEQSKTAERELRDEETANLSDGEFKALVIKMLTKLIVLGKKMKEQMKYPK